MATPKSKSAKKHSRREDDIRAAIETLDSLIDGDPNDALGRALSPVRDLLATILSEHEKK